MTTDKFGNAIPFVAIAPTIIKDGKEIEQPIPADLIDQGPELTHPESKELTIKLDILHVQRGDSRGQRYWGKRVTTDNLDKVIEFFGGECIASLVDTALNTQNQRYCLGQGEKFTGLVSDEKDLLATLTTRTVRGESKADAKKAMEAIARELQAAMAKGEKMEVLLEIQTRLAASCMKMV